MTSGFFASESRLAGGLLILSVLLGSAGIALWMGRNLYHWQASGGASYLMWERSLIMADMVAAVLGFMLLTSALNAATVPVAARVGLMLLVLATVLGLSWEAAQISRGGSNDALISAYVVLALLGQAAIGLALLQSGLPAGWIGWSTILWNVGWLVVLPLLNTGDLYYPIIHMMMPLLIGIALLLNR